MANRASRELETRPRANELDLGCELADGGDPDPEEGPGRAQGGAVRPSGQHLHNRVGLGVLCTTILHTPPVHHPPPMMHHHLHIRGTCAHAS